MNNQVKNKVLSIIKKYQPILLLSRNTFEVKYPTKNKNAVAECDSNYPYLNVTIKIGDEFIKMLNDGEDIEPYIVHEMCHIITDPLYYKAISRYASEDEIKDERELLTDYICNIIIINKLKKCPSNQNHK